MSKLCLLGFSIRASTPDLAAWSRKRRQDNLLDPEIGQVISLDDAAWPIPQDIDTFLKSVSGMEDVTVDENALNLMISIPSSWLHERMSLPGFGQACVLIAAAVAEQDYSEIKRTYKWLIDETYARDAMHVVAHWNFLGFDVVDVTGISALTNCGIGAVISDNERSVWQGKLASTGLFESIKDARDFAQLADVLVDEHAPFLPVGIWQR